jgi:glutamate synthase (NADPH) small chain
MLAIGFDGVEHVPLLDGLGLTLNRRGTLSCGADWQTTAPGVFVCGDAHRGASLIVGDCRGPRRGPRGRHIPDG